MDVTMIRVDTEQKFMPSRSMSEGKMVNDAVDITLLRSFEDATAVGEPDLIVELIDLFFDDVPQKLSAMREAITLGDANSLCGAAHSLKGSSSSLGAYKMAELCDQIEASANDRLSKTLNTIQMKIEHEFERVRLVFAAERQGRLMAQVGLR